MEALWIFAVPLKRIKSVESSVVLIVVSGTEIFHLQSGIELFSCIQQISRTRLAVSYAGITSKHFAIGIIGVIGCNSAIIISQLAGTAMAII